MKGYIVLDMYNKKIQKLAVPDKENMSSSLYKIMKLDPLLTVVLLDQRSIYL